MLSLASPEKIPSVALRIVDLQCGYPGQTVINGVSLTVDEREFVGILGPNGSGKTTFLLALSGVLPIQGGTVEVFGRAVDRLKPRERARLMAVVTQDSEVRLPFTCQEVVHMGRYPHQKRWRPDRVEDHEAVRTAMELTHTVPLAERLITALSGGERQRVTMAKALAQGGVLLLLDEATSAMDVHRKLQIFKVLDQLNRKDGVTIVAVLHDVNLAALFCRRLLFLKDGRIAADGETHRILVPEVLEAVYETTVVVHELPGLQKRQVVFLP